MAVVECPNHEANLQMCPCTVEDCERRGVCCLCVQNHSLKGQKSACMRGVERPRSTRGHAGVASGKCGRHGGNLEFCPCDYESCGNRGVCCDCIRNHWGNATYPASACMRA